MEDDQDIIDRLTADGFTQRAILNEGEHPDDKPFGKVRAAAEAQNLPFQIVDHRGTTRLYVQGELSL